MTYQTNSPIWVNGFNGNQAPSGGTPQQQFQHEQGRLQKQAEVQKAYEATWKK